jgi:putative peptide zinc metalloprotease protein
MATLADSLVSSSSRPLALRMRPDLTYRRHQYQGRAYWVVKEPIGLNYYRFHEEEFAILNMLDGQASMEDIKERFELEFTPQKITFQDLHQFVGMLHRSGLVLSGASGQGRQLKIRRDKKRSREFWGKFTNVFAVRWRGIDPEWILTKIYPYTGWFFHRAMVMLLLSIATAALMLVIVQFDVFRSRLPTFHQFFGAHNWLYLGVCMAGVKVLHEFGHGLTCKRFGGECHEMGFMLLVFTPALYCNVSDSWMLPNKWHRVAIGAAGMYVEMFIASICTFIWWFSEPGLLNQISLRLMFICSVSTLLFNGNPLLRFDGYYILMDVTEIPNLRQKATEILKRFLAQLCLGIEQQESPFLPQRNRFFFGLYTIAAVLYRWFIVFSIFMFLSKVLEPYGLKIIGQLLGLMGVFGLVVQPLWQLGKFFYTPGRTQKVKQHRVAMTLGMVGLVVLLIAFVPLPYHVDCAVRLVPRDAPRGGEVGDTGPLAASVYVSIPSRLKRCLVLAGQRVKAGELIAQLENQDEVFKEMELQGLLNEAVTRLQTLQQQRSVDPQAAEEVLQVRDSIESLEHQLRQQQRKVQLLSVTSPIDGVILPASYRTAGRAANGQLPGWKGTLLQPENQGAYLAADDVICLVASVETDQQEAGRRPLVLVDAELVVDQADIELIKVGDEVQIRLELYTWKTYTSQISSIALTNLTESPISLSSQAGGQLGTQVDKAGNVAPISTSYHARAHLLDENGEFNQIDLRGKARIATKWKSLGWRLYRFAARTFRFQM